MDLELSSRVAVVAGGSRGLGFAAAQALGAEGCRVAILARNEETLADAVSRLSAAGIDAIGVSADLTRRSEVAEAFATVRQSFGSPDVLVYNNSGARDVYFDEASDEDSQHAFETLIMGFTWAAREVVPAMKGNSWGRIVTLGSLCAKEPHKDFPMALHNFGRPAQVGLSKTLANELGQFGITVNTIATGMLDHDGFAVARAYDRNLSAEEIYRLRIKDIPLKRTDTARELGDLCAFLCSERAAFLTGQTILLDGGRVGSLM